MTRSAATSQAWGHCLQAAVQPLAGQALVLQMSLGCVLSGIHSSSVAAACQRSLVQTSTWCHFALEQGGPESA